MPKFSVTIPVVIYKDFIVEAEYEGDAKNKALLQANEWNYEIHESDSYYWDVSGVD